MKTKARPELADGKRLARPIVLLMIAMAACQRAPISATEAPNVDPPSQLYRYSVVAKFDGPFPIFADGSGLTDVDDRFEVVFDFDGRSGAISGEPQIANSGSRIVEPGLATPDCGSPERTTYFDRAELKSIEVDGGATLRLHTETNLSGFKTPPGCSDDDQVVEPRIDRSVLSVSLPADELIGSDGEPIEVMADGWSFSFSRKMIDPK